MACRAFKKVHVTWNVARTNSAPSLVNSSLPVWFCRWTFIQSPFVYNYASFFYCCLSNALLGVQWKVAWPAFPPILGPLCAVLPSDKPRTHSVHSSAIFSHSFSCHADNTPLNVWLLINCSWDDISVLSTCMCRFFSWFGATSHTTYFHMPRNQWRR